MASNNNREIIEMALDTHVIQGYVAAAIRQYLKDVDSLAEYVRELLKLLESTREKEENIR